MSSDSDSGDGPNPIPKPLESHFESVTIEDSNPFIENLETSVEPIGDSDNVVREFDEVSTELQQQTSFNGSKEENGDHERVSSEDEPIEFGSDARGFGDGDDADTVVWRSKNSKLEGDGPPSPSSSGYAGERGSSSASSGSRIGDLSEDEIREIGNDGVLDSQSAWVPGKRHVNECDLLKFMLLGLYNRRLLL